MGDIRLNKEPEKYEWKDEIDPRTCWVCGYDFTRFNWGDYRIREIHHIERRGHATGKKEDGTPRYDEKCNFFSACRPCHQDKLDSVGTMSHALQLGIKMRHDPKYFDLEQWLRLRDQSLKSTTRVTLKEIEDALDWWENQN